jgi:acetyl esterase/lipase
MLTVAALLTASLIAPQTAPQLPEIEGKVVYLWSNGAPGSESRKDEPEQHPKPWSTTNIYNPSITIYEPPAGVTPTGTAIVIAPGGGHSQLVVGEEGTKPAKMLAAQGITGIVLKYRLFREEKSGLTFEKDNLADAERSIRMVRSMASKLKVTKVGMMGFSAGGETLNLACFQGKLGDANAPDPIDRLNSKPDFAMWVYPGPLGIPEKVEKDAPLAFFLVAQDDGASKNCLDLAMKYRAAKVPYALHVLSGGGHGFNMGDRSKLLAVKGWFGRLTEWLSDSGLMNSN